ncbi:MAG: Maf family protein [Anaerolineae bacterium]
MRSESVSLILASVSPRRQELVSALGLSVQVLPADVDETRLAEESPVELAKRLSIAKAEGIAERFPTAVVIAADTLVALEQQILGKPADAREATAMLAALRARTHRVYSGLALVQRGAGRRSVQVVETLVHMRDYTNEEIDRYVTSGDPMDKAGAYAIQSATFRPVAAVEGCYANVMGLPICHLYHVLSSWGVDVRHHPTKVCPMGSTCGCQWLADGPSCKTTVHLLPPM